MQLEIFTKPQSGYSYDTSYPAFKDVTPARISNKERIYQTIKELGATCIKQIHDKTGIPDAIISARIDCLRKAGKVRYSGKEDYMNYKNRIRKKIVVA